MKLVVSGIQPTGLVHLGNYLGAIKNWKSLQSAHDSLFLIVDQHAITSSYFKVPTGKEIAQELSSSITMTAATLKACGINNVFIQSRVPEISQLMWIFSCISPMSWFQKMTQFKEKKAALDGASLGLFSYPALMAADILLFKGELVPVGDDQTQHLELSQDIAQRFNSLFGTYFPIPECVLSNLYTAKSPRIMSLRDGTAKMSKSSKSDFSRINILDSPELIGKKIAKAKTDSIPEIFYDENSRPDLANLIRIYSELVDKTPEDLIATHKWTDIADFKGQLSDLIITSLKPIKDKTFEIMDTDGLNKELSECTARAREIGVKNFEEIKHLVGYN